jgi:YVTN family beta-propeller protein
MKDRDKSIHLHRVSGRAFAKTNLPLADSGLTLLRAARPAILFLLALVVATASADVKAQTLLATITVGTTPTAVAVNSSTNKIYVANRNSNNVTVIDGVTNSTITVRVGIGPQGLAINTATNKIYVANANSSTVTVIDGTNNTTSTIAVGSYPIAVAANTTTNKIYVANYFGSSVTVIDGATGSTTTILTGTYPIGLAINQTTNTVYVANSGSDSVTAIDAGTDSTSTLAVGHLPEAVAVNPQTNKIYVANYGSNTVTVIDGATNSSTNLNVGLEPSAVAVNPVTNQVYVTNEQDGTATIIAGATLSTTTVQAGSDPIGVQVDTATNTAYLANFLWNGTLTMIDGTSYSTSTISVGAYPAALAGNWQTNRIYVLNSGDNTVSVIGKDTLSAALQFIPVTPCRVVDTRWRNGPLGGPSIPAGGFRSFSIPSSNCGVPTTATAYSLNVTVVPHGILGVLTLWPTGEDRPGISAMNSWDGRTKANAAIVPAGSSGAISVYASNTTDVVLDVNGYFVPTPAPSALAFYPLKPCRVADTRAATGPLGGPYLHGSAEPRQFPVLDAVSCNIANNAQAYSLNFTVVPRRSQLWVLSTWPAGQPQSSTSTLNAPTGTVTANAVIVPAGNNGAIDLWASDDTDLVIDINGYFAPPGTGGLSLYPSTPCRALDTRNTIGLFSGQLVANIAGSPCGIPASAQGFVLNATVVPNGPLWVLTLWPDGQGQPSASTLNAWDGVVTSNLAIVPTTNGAIDADAAGSTNLILDISSYFAP